MESSDKHLNEEQLMEEDDNIDNEYINEKDFMKRLKRLEKENDKRLDNIKKLRNEIGRLKETIGNMKLDIAEGIGTDRYLESKIKKLEKINGS